MRHARARTARVVVTWAPDTVQLVVTDDGSASDGAVPHHGRGLVGMRERAAVVGGEVHAGPAAGPGWEVRAVLPVTTARSAEQPDPVPTPSGASA